jgi:hypothetical protein
MVVRGPTGAWVPFLAGLGFLVAFGAMTFRDGAPRAARPPGPDRDLAEALRVSMLSPAIDATGRRVRLDRPRAAAARPWRPHSRFRWPE